MDNWLKFQYSSYNEGVTEKAKRSQRMEELVQARYQVCRQIRILIMRRRDADGK